MRYCFVHRYFKVFLDKVYINYLKSGGYMAVSEVVAGIYPVDANGVCLEK